MIGVIAALAATGIAGPFLFTYAYSRRIEMRYPPVGALVDVGPGMVHVVEMAPEGNERGVVLLVHGASGNFADLHVALADRLSARGFRVFSVDRPGHGWSARLAGRAASSPERQAEWIRAALASRGVDRAIVVAHSLAGVLGLAMALNAPQFVRGLVLLAPVSHPWIGGVLWYYTLAASRRLGPLFRWLVVVPAGLLTISGGVRPVFEPCVAPPDYIERTRLRLMLRPWQFKSNAEDIVDIEAHVAVLSKRYGTIRVPTAVLTGDRDRIVHPDTHAMGCVRDIPGATLRVLEGVGHSPHHGAPESVIEAILHVDRRARETSTARAYAAVSSTV
jgi:pimeloyl-ACP methyl ester carboxylesterase